MQRLHCESAAKSSAWMVQAPNVLHSTLHMQTVKKTNSGGRGTDSFYFSSKTSVEVLQVKFCSHTINPVKVFIK